MLDDYLMKFNKKLAFQEFIWLVFKRPKDLLMNTYEFCRKSYYAKYNQKYHHYSQLPTIEITQLIGDINEEIHNYSYRYGNSTPLDIILLKKLVEQKKTVIFLKLDAGGEKPCLILHPTQKIVFHYHFQQKSYGHFNLTRISYFKMDSL